MLIKEAPYPACRSLPVPLSGSKESTWIIQKIRGGAGAYPGVKAFS